MRPFLRGLFDKTQKTISYLAVDCLVYEPWRSRKEDLRLWLDLKELRISDEVETRATQVVGFQDYDGFEDQDKADQAKLLLEDVKEDVKEIGEGFPDWKALRLVFGDFFLKILSLKL